VIITFFLVIVSVVTIYTAKNSSVYMSTSQIEIERPFLSDQNIENALSKEYRSINEYFGTQLYLLLNPDLAQKVIEDLKLQKDIEAIYGVGNADEGSSSSPSIATESTKDLTDTNNTKTPIEMQAPEIEFSMDDMVGWYLSSINVEPVIGTYLVNISFTGPTPEMAARVANAHARAFIEKNAQLQYQDYQKALDWLKVQLDEQKKNVEGSERAIFKYKEKYGIVSFDQKADIISPKLIKLNNLLVDADTERLEKQTAYEQLEAFSIDNESLLSMPEIKNNSVIEGLNAQLVDLNFEKMELSSVYRSRHPKVEAVNTKIELLEQEIINEVTLLRASIKTELDRAVAFENAIKLSLEEHKQLAMAHNEKTIDYSVLQREAESNQNIYDILLEQVREVGVISNTGRNNMRMVSEAKVPQLPLSSKKKLKVLLSMVLGLCCGTALAFFFEYMDNSVRTPEDVRKHLGMPVLGIMPYDKSLKGNITPALLLDDGSNRESRYNTRDFLTNLNSDSSLMQAGVTGQVIMVESAVSGEGKSTVLAKSAMNLSRQGLRVLMVDADTQRPTLHNIFGLNGNGIANDGLLEGMSNILSCKINQGSLEKYSVDDLFSLIMLKKLSGKLIITSDTYSMTAVFDKGCFVHLQDDDTPLHNRLGAMLVNGGFITESQLKDSLDRTKRTGQPLGYILINAGYINQDQIQGPLKLQVEEQLQRLFSWKHGTFTFKSGNIDVYKDGKIRFEEDFASIIDRLGKIGGSRLLEDEILTKVKSLNEPNLSILPAGTEYRNSGDLIYYTLLSKFLTILKQHYHVVLVDVPPILDTMNSVKPLYSLVDGVIFVIKSGQVSAKHINEAVNYIKESETKIIGTVLNQAKEEKGQYYG
jgi:uncharacterized protein involved in exopolysaccharide biosynthesis/Mrp family chromosome partitioning ATPase